MLSKCANPKCPSPFLYLSKGKLFRWETPSVSSQKPEFGSDPLAKQPPNRIEFFWLCSRCSPTMTLVYEKGTGITVKPLERAKRAVAV
jgi:hypothetical protein